MDFTQLIEQLGKGGNTWIILILVAAFLFKDKIPFLNKPATPATPTPPPVVDPATPATPVTPNDRPVIEALLKLLLTTAPLILKGAESEAAKQDKPEPPK